MTRSRWDGRPSAFGSTWSTKEEEAIVRAAVQTIRYERWQRNGIEAQQEARRLGHRRRREDRFRDKHPKPPTPRKSMTEEQRTEFQEARRRWFRVLSRAAKDQRAAGSPERRRIRFPEPTGEEVLDRIAGKDTRYWARLANATLALTRDPAFCAFAAAEEEARDDS